jgi:hypothetical protein
MIGTATAATYNSSTGVGTVDRVDIANQSYVRITGLAANKYFKVTIQNTGANNAQIRQDTTGTVVATIVSGACFELRPRAPRQSCLHPRCCEHCQTDGECEGEFAHED